MTEHRIPLLNIDNKNIFFHKLETYDLFKYSSSDYIWEDVYNIAILQGKKIKQIDPTHSLYKIIGSESGIVILDIKETAKNIRDEEILRLQGELSNSYQRLDLLELQLGIRGSERLERCELCKKTILPYQSWITTETNGKSHIECDLNKTIDELEKNNRKKDDNVKRWSKDAQRFGNENQSLRIEKDNNKNTIKELEYQVNILSENLTDYKNNNDKLSDRLEVLNNDLSFSNKKLKEYENINNVYEDLLRVSLSLIIRTLKLLGDNSTGEFQPIPVINLSGEQKIELKGWCKPLYDELYDCINEIREVL